RDVNSPNLFDPITGPLTDVAQVDGNGFGCATLAGGSLSGQIALIQRGPAVAACPFNTKLDNAAAPRALPAIRYYNIPNDIVYMSLTDATLPAVFVTQADGQNLKAQIAASPGITGTVDFSGFTPFQLNTSDVVSSYSSTGPTNSGKIKPDLLAVGGD